MLVEKNKNVYKKTLITKGIFISTRVKQNLYKTRFKRGESHKIEFFKKYANILTLQKKLSAQKYLMYALLQFDI